MIRVSVFYPAPGKFNFDYYVNSHMAMVHKLLAPYNLVKSEVDRGVGNDATYVAVGHLFFNSLEDMQKALAAHDADFAADGVNYTDIKPQFQVSEIIA